jgi:hypothetical protein
MSKHDLRDDKECENCGYSNVEFSFCPKCGQHNVETHQSFIHLVTHFAEDLTHYDSSFWKTIKYLLFRPAKLTKEYLSGRRQLYVPPVKLYIFISFLTFFLLAVLPNFSEKEDEHGSAIASPHTKAVSNTVQLNKKESPYSLPFSSDNNYIHNPVSYKSVKEMDSIEKLKPESLRLSSFERKWAKNLINLYEHNSPKQVTQKLEAALPHNIPKAIFLYMPIFAFWLWLFHGKKRWYFFDHGIFTLHYFSFLLLGATFLAIIQCIATAFYNYGDNIAQKISAVITFIIFIWQMIYFYRSHRKMYGESLAINLIKSTALFIINISLIILITKSLMIYTLLNLH